MLVYHPPGKHTPSPGGTPPEAHPPRQAHTPRREAPPGSTHPSPGRPPPRRRLPLRTVRILLECILVHFIFRCVPGYTEALFSAKCVQESKCRDYWALVMVVFLAVGYSAFLLFQKDFKDFMFGAPLGH